VSHVAFVLRCYGESIRRNCKYLRR
jgi:hypothetical protein